MAYCVEDSFTSKEDFLRLDKTITAEKYCIKIEIKHKNLQVKQSILKESNFTL